MKKFLLLLMLCLSVYLFSESKVSIKTTSDTLAATITLEDHDEIILDYNSLYLFIESEKFDFKFGGFPDGEMDDTGEIVYKDKLTLSGSLIRKDISDSSDSSINVVLGYQTKNSDGDLNIPIEISEEIVVKSPTGINLIVLFIIISFILIFSSAFLILKRKKR